MVEASQSLRENLSRVSYFPGTEPTLRLVCLRCGRRMVRQYDLRYFVLFQICPFCRGLLDFLHFRRAGDHVGWERVPQPDELTRESKWKNKLIPVVTRYGRFTPFACAAVMGGE